MKQHLPSLLSLLLTTAGFAPASSVLENVSSRPPCKRVAVEYETADAESLAKIVVTKLKHRPAAIQDEKDPQYQPRSPQQTAAFNRVLVPDTAKLEIHREAIQVFTLSGKPAAWEIRTSDVHDASELIWLNEELIFIRVWWGRIRSTDLIFQIHPGKSIYAKDADYGELTSPCNE